MQAIRRIFVEKKPGFDIEAQKLWKDLRENLGISALARVRVINRYDVAGLDEEIYARARTAIFAEPPVDMIYDEELPVGAGEQLFAVEYLPGQYDQRADWAAQCIQILTQQNRPDVASAKVIVLDGAISPQELSKIKSYLINPVEAREASLAKPDKLSCDYTAPPDVKTLTGFTDMSEAELTALSVQLGLAMNCQDLQFCQAYFRDTEKRDPTMTELRAIDTYWSDHCRHTTFFTELEQIDVEHGPYSEPIKAAYNEYRHAREQIYRGKESKPVSLMDIATLAMKEARIAGILEDLDVSDEINACSIIVNVDTKAGCEEWLVMFKNETHNHPTEIEPFGGAATCLGGAIRDPLSGRSYVYQAMRVTGSGDPRTPVAATLPGKLPQRTITTGAAAGYSSYGNQIGLATGQVAEVYDEGFVAKRMEIGAVIAAAPRENVVRCAPVAGDAVVLVGGRTGRDGIGGATGSSKEHTEESLATCGAEVQKGNPPTERKIQRLFRKPEVSRMIKRCNDFGAGGVSVAIGELADGVEINLDAIPKKYEGLDGTELAISESQERMAVVVAAAEVNRFIAMAAAENLEATIVAQVTDKRRLRMLWRGQAIVDISRDFLDTSGCRQYAKATIQAPAEEDNYFKKLPDEIVAAPDLESAWLANLGNLNVCSQKGLVERFDSTIGAGTVLLPFGGQFQLTPVDGMVAKIPLLSGETNTATVMTYGYQPQLAKWSPFHGGLYAVVEAVAKQVVLGSRLGRIRLTLQEYFEKLGQDEHKWGKPVSALLGAYMAQKQLATPAIGGKDSMSGSFKDLHVPPTLVAFAVAPVDARHVVSPEFKRAGSKVALVRIVRDEKEMPDFAKLIQNYNKVGELIAQGAVRAASVVKTGGIAAAVSKMCFGNRLGFAFNSSLQWQELFQPEHGSILLEVETPDEECLQDEDFCQVIGSTIAEPEIRIEQASISLDRALAAWEEPLEAIFPARTPAIMDTPYEAIFTAGPKCSRTAPSIAKPRIFIPVFPGTNCEYDTARAFEQAGGLPQVAVMRNLTARDIEHSIDDIVKNIEIAQIIMLPGGFSAGDEPDGSGKFIAAVFRNPRIREAITAFLKQRDGLMLGICNGFQALIKLGLIPYGEITDMTENSPTLTYNVIGRHVSTMVRTKVVSNLSPWLSRVQVGDIHTVPVSHGEGRLIAGAQQLSELFAKGQVATQYVDFAGRPSYDSQFNPNGAMGAVEGLTSPDGRVFGKMAHSERIGRRVAINVPGNKDQHIFEAGVQYFR